MADEEVVQPDTTLPVASPAPVNPWEKYSAGQQQPWERRQEQPSSLPRGIRTLAKDTTESLAQKIRGKNEFDYPEITSAIMAGGELNDIVVDEINNQLGESSGGKAMEFMSLLKRARGEKGMIDILKRFDPELEESKDKYGNAVVKFAGKPYYINRSGLSERDLDEAFRDTLLTLPFSGAARAAAPAAGLITRMAGQAVAGAAGSLTSDVVSMGAGSKQPIDTGAMLMSALGGAGGEAAGSALGWAINRVVHNPSRYYNAKTGELTDEGAMVFSSAGFDPSDITAKLGKAFADQARKTGATGATARDVAAKEFDIPLRRGQATQDLTTQQFEEAGLAGAKGPVVRGILGEMDEAQKKAFEKSKDLVGESLAPGQSKDFIRNAGEALSGVRAVGQNTQRAVTEAYDAAKEAMSNTRVTPDAVNSLPGIVRAKLADTGFNRYAPDKSPLVQEALDLVDKLAAGKIVPERYAEGFPGHTAKTLLEPIEEVRKIIGGKAGIRARASNDPAQRYAIDLIVDGIDDWMIAQRDGGLIRGDVNAVKLINDAIDTASKRFNLLGKRSKWDNAGATVDRMINDSSMTDREAANMIYGMAVTGQSDTAAKVSSRVKDILNVEAQSGQDAPAWQALKRGLWQKMVAGPEGANQPGPREVSNTILKFLSQNRALANTMYNDMEQSLMRRYAMAIRPMVPMERSQNVSGSGYEIQRALSGMLGTGIPGQVYMWSQKIPSTVKVLRGREGAPVLPRGLPGAGPVGAVTTQEAVE